MKSKIIARLLPLFLFVSFSSVAFGQNLSAYLDTRIKATVKARTEQTDNTKQAAPPAATGNSTTLVEQSSAPDLVGFGLDLLNLSDATSDKASATPKTITFSGYALKSFLSNEDALDPEIYNKNATWRSVSFTLGYDVPVDTSDRNPVVGIKWLAFNKRDVSSTQNQNEIRKIQTALNPASVAFANIFKEVEIFLFGALQTARRLPMGVATLDAFEGTLASATDFPMLLSSLTDDEKKGIDGIISKRISAFVNLDKVSKDAVKAIRSKPQLAIAVSTTQRKSQQPDEYSSLLTFDKGMGANSISMNGSFIFRKNPVGNDSKGGRFAAAIQLPLQGFKALEYKAPLLFSLGADATGLTGESPTYRAQAKLSIPLLPGIEIPISVSVANRTELVREKTVTGKFGVTFDLSKSLGAFRDGFQVRGS